MVSSLLNTFRWLQITLEAQYNTNYYMGYGASVLFWLGVVFAVVILLLLLPACITSCVARSLYKKHLKKLRTSGGAAKRPSRRVRLAKRATNAYYACAYFATAFCIAAFAAWLSAFTLLPIWGTIPMGALLVYASFIHWNRETRNHNWSSASSPSPDERRGLLRSDGSFEDYEGLGDESESLRKSFQQEDDEERGRILRAVYTCDALLQRIPVVSHVRAYLLSLYNGLQTRPICSFLSLLAVLAAVSILGMTTCYTCIAYYPLDISNYMTRRFQSSICERGSICFAYFTVAGDISSEMIVNFQIDAETEPEDAYVLLRKEGLSEVQRFNATCFDMDNISFEVWRIQCWADLVDLDSSSTYYVQVLFDTFEGKNNVTVEYDRELKFRTGPKSTDPAEKQAVTFVSGGDLAWSYVGIALSQSAALHEPLFAIVGGDVSYENGIAACYRRWDSWFRDWETYMTTPSNYSIPLLTAPGNHEAGGFMQSRAYDNFYIRYFPHEIGLADKLKDQQERTLWHSHVISNHSIVISLDSWVHHEPLEQAPYLKETLAAHQFFKNKIAAYHVSAYPSKKQPVHNVGRKITAQLLQHFVPLFDEYSLSVSFENHYHALKATHPLRNSSVVSGKGTVYVGDGSWGVTDVDMNPDNYDTKNPIFSKTPTAMSHIWIVRSSLEGMNLHAIGWDTASSTVVEPVPKTEIRV